MKNGLLNNLKHDLPASIIVFLVAVPLCLGIALASGAPLFSGIIAGVIGGNNYKKPFLFDSTKHFKDGKIHLELAEDVTFINKASIQRTLEQIPEGASVIIDATKTVNIDNDVIEIIEDFKTNAKFKNIDLEIIELSSILIPNQTKEVENALVNNLLKMNGKVLTN